MRHTYTTSLLMVLLTACLSSAAPLKIVATTGMVADAVRNVAGERAEVTALIGEGVDPHLFKPTRDDVSKMLQADMIFYNGLLLEGRMEDTIKKIAARGTPVVALADSLDKSKLAGDAHHPDPHVWMDPGLWKQTIPGVASALAAFDSPGKADYEANAAKFVSELDALNDYVRASIATIPAAQRVLITAHDAFHYLSQATGLKVLGIQGISTESEAGVADMNRIVDTIIENRIPAVFIESSVPDKNVRAVIEGAASRGQTVRLGGELYSDAMGAPGTYEGTYIGMLDHNATIITRALGGVAPASGMSGKLRP